MYTNALIYCRVSSAKQVNDGNGLSSQEKLCKDYADRLKYRVVKTFKEEGVSGSLFERPAMRNLIAFLDSNPIEKYVVVFDDLKRFARDVTVHLQLKAQLLSRGVRLECPNFRFEDSPEGHFIENVTAAAAQYDREANRRQVIQKMRARLEDGFWCFRSVPPGLRYEKALVGGKILINVEPFASIYKAAIEKYRDNYLNTLEETQHYIQKQYILKGISRPISINGVQNILSELLYTGFIEYPKWDIPLKKGKHEGFIDYETFQIVQNKLHKKAKPRLRSDYNVDFPLRGFALCDSCHKPLTASWNKGRNKSYPNYWCMNKKCDIRYKTIKRKSLEDDFERILMKLKPRELVLDVIGEVLSDVWQQSHSDSLQSVSYSNKKITELEKQINDYIKRAAKAKHENLAEKYEEEANKLLKEQQALQSPTHIKNHSAEEFGTAKKIVFETIKNPLAMWQSKNYDNRKTILYMYFDERPTYKRDMGFGTSNIAYPIELINKNKFEKNQLVEMPGIEPGSEEARLQKNSET